MIGDIPYQIEWMSTYCFNQRVIEKFKIGRIFFAGDSAHSLPPYGSRGMNSGIQDADNLAWKMAYVINGQAQQELLETYHAERYAAALENLRVTEATIKFMAPTTGIQRFFRNTVLSLAIPFKSLRRWVNHGKMAQPFTYAHSDIIDAGSNHPWVGRFMPDCKVFIANKKSRLRKLLGHEFTLIFFGNSAEGKEFVLNVSQNLTDLPVKVILAYPKGFGLETNPTNTSVIYYDDIKFFQSLYHDCAAWYVIRPDGHIAGKYSLEDSNRAYLIVGRCCYGYLRQENLDKHEHRFEQAS